MFFVERLFQNFKMNAKRLFSAVLIIVVICDAAPAILGVDNATTSNYSVTVEQQNSSAQNHNPIWIRSEIVAVNWRRHCITTLLCTEPRLTLTNIAPNTNERLMADWRFANYVFMEKPLVLHGYWTSAKRLSDLMIQVSIIGIDPTFRFSRLCDETRTVAVAPSSAIQNADNFPEEDVMEQTFELSGACFNVTLQIYVYVGTRCPWNPASENDASSSEGGQLFLVMQNIKNQSFLSVLVIALYAVGNIAAWCVIYELRRKNCVNNAGATSYNRSDNHTELSVDTVSTIIRGNNGSDVRFCKGGKLRQGHEKLTKWNYQPSPLSSSSRESSSKDSTSPPSSTSSSNISTHPQNNFPAAESRGVVVKLPTTRRCDHCFLRLAADSTTMAVVSATIGRTRSDANDSDHDSTSSYCDCAEMSILLHSSTTGSSLNVSRFASSRPTTDSGKY